MRCQTRLDVLRIAVGQRAQRVDRHDEVTFAHAPVRGARERPGLCANRRRRQALLSLQHRDPMVHPLCVDACEVNIAPRLQHARELLPVLRLRMCLPLVLAQEILDGHDARGRSVIRRHDAAVKQRMQLLRAGVALGLAGEREIDRLVEHARSFEDVLNGPVVELLLACHGQPSCCEPTHFTKLAWLVDRSFWLVEAPLGSLSGW